MSTAQAKLDSAFDRLDAIINRRVREEEAALTRDDAARADAARVKASRDSERRVEIASRYAPAFLAHNVEVPMPLDDERPVDFRDRLFDRLRHRLPPSSEWSTTRADELTTQAMDAIEPLLIAEAAREGASPSESSLPSDGSMLMRTRTDANTGTKYNEFFGKRSFVADMGRPGRRVRAIVDRNSGQAIWGRIG